MGYSRAQGASERPALEVRQMSSEENVTTVGVVGRIVGAALSLSPLLSQTVHVWPQMLLTLLA